MNPGIADGASAAPVEPGPARLTCRVCGRVHRTVTLAPGEKASCIRCGTALAKASRLGLDASLAWAIAGLILAVPAGLLPFVTVSNLANERVGVLFSGVGVLWGNGMRLVAVAVLVCGMLAPVLMLGTLSVLLLPIRLGRPPARSRAWLTAAHAFEHWAMPEVQVLAVLVAFVKLHTMVNIEFGPGFWCYAAVSLMTLFAWRSFNLDATATVPLERAACS